MNTDTRSQPEPNSKPKAWQQVYHQLALNKIKGISSYQVNGNLYIVIPLEEKENSE